MRPLDIDFKDVLIWERVLRRFDSRISVQQRTWEATLFAGRRDADLMHAAQQLNWSWLVQVGSGDWYPVRGKETSKRRDPVWHAAMLTELP